MFAPPYKVFWQNLTNPITWQILKQNFMPNFFGKLFVKPIILKNVKFLQKNMLR